MKITKYGHSCLLIEETGVRILVDPGIFSAVPEELSPLDAILVTHEHPDHLQVDVVERLRVAQPSLKILTQQAVGMMLDKAGVTSELLLDGRSKRLGDLTIAAFGKQHEVIVPEVPVVANTGYLIGGRLFVPGDALTVPNQPVEVLALPICAPWSKMAETLAYALRVSPKIVIPIHDGFLIPNNPFQVWVERTLPEKGIRVVNLELGVPSEL